MYNFMSNLLVGIIGGIYSGIIVSRSFLIKADIDEQVESVNNISSDLDTISSLIDKMIEVLKKANDSAGEFENKFAQETKKTLDAIEWMHDTKSKVLDEIIFSMCAEQRRLEIKNAKSVELVVNIIHNISQYKTKNEFSFEELEQWKGEVDNSKKILVKYVDEINRTFFRRILFDKLMIVMVGACLIIAIFIA